VADLIEDLQMVLLGHLHIDSRVYISGRHCADVLVKRQRCALEKIGKIREWRVYEWRDGCGAGLLKETIAAAVLNNPGLSTRKIALKVGCSQGAVAQAMKAANSEYINKNDRCIHTTPVPENIKQALVADYPT
jgi:hypothetical protein